VQHIDLSIEQWRLRFLAHVTAAGSDFLRSTLYVDASIWNKCEQEYGAGSGYRDAVVRHLREWFEDDERQEILAGVESRVVDEWKKQVLVPLGQLCGETAVVGGGT
jgi:hypothetical protein